MPSRRSILRALMAAVAVSLDHGCGLSDVLSATRPRARESSVERYGWRKAAEEALTVYEAVLGQRTNAPEVTRQRATWANLIAPRPPPSTWR